MISYTTSMTEGEGGSGHDPAWAIDNRIFVMEAKTLFGEEAPTVDRGIGQVLRYRSQFRRLLGADIQITPVLLTDRKPVRRFAVEGAADAGVRLLWPDCLHRLV